MILGVVCASGGYFVLPNLTGEHISARCPGAPQQPIVMLSPFLCRDFRFVHSYLDRSGPIIVSPSTIAFRGTMTPFVFYRLNPARTFFTRSSKKFIAGKMPFPIVHNLSVSLLKPSFSYQETPQSVPSPAPDSPKFPNKALIEPRLGSANPLFDRKLLDIVHEEGVRRGHKNPSDGQ